MIDSDRLKIEEIRLQEKVNSPNLLEIRSDASDAEQRIGERNALTEQLSQKRLEIIKAMEKEDREAQAAMARHVDTDGWTPELKEFRGIAQQATLREHFAAVVESRNVTGATKEYNDHVLGPHARGEYPLELLLDRDQLLDFDPLTWQSLKHDPDEERAIVTGVAATHGIPTFVDRLLASSEAAYLRATFPAVGPGRHSYPVVSGTSVAASYNAGRE